MKMANPKHVPESAKFRIYAEKSTKRGFSKKALARIDILFLFLVHMNPSKNLNRQCAMIAIIFIFVLLLET